MLSATDIVDRASKALFGRRLVNNVARAMLVEAMIDAALDPRWEWCSGDWSECDFRHESGARLEVKQSAAIQSWHAISDRPSVPRFDVGPKLAWSREAGWASASNRNAEIFIFAFHAIADHTAADHRDPQQWVFFVAATSSLPFGVKSIGLNTLQRIAEAMPIEAVAGMVEAIRKGATARA